MKKLMISCLAVAAMFTAANAQTTTTTTTTTADDRLKPVAGTWGVGFSLNGLANIGSGNWMTTGLQGAELYDPLNILPAGFTVGDVVSQEMLFGRYYFTDQTALRFGLGLNSYGERNTSRDSIGNEEQETITRFSGFSWGITGGIEHHCYDNSRRIDPYFGGQLSFGMAGPFKSRTTVDLPGTGGFSSETMNKWRGGTNFSVDFIVGAQVFIAKNWALGIESNLGWGMLSMGGKFNATSSTTPNGGTEVSSEFEDFSRTSVSGFRVGNSTSIRCSFFW